MSETNSLPAATVVELVPLDGLAPARVQALAARLSRTLAVPCRVGEPSARGSARLPGRDQVDADAALSSLESRAGRDAVVLGVTPEDMAIPIFTFVFGRARLDGRAAVVSLARLDPAFYGLPSDEGQLLARAVQEARHELGHLASLPHCAEPSCLMRFAGSVEKADLRGGEFCEGCGATMAAWLLGREAS